MTDSLRAFAAERSPHLTVPAMEVGALEWALGKALMEQAPEAWATGTQIVCPPAGRKAFERLVAPWHVAEFGVGKEPTLIKQR